MRRGLARFLAAVAIFGAGPATGYSSPLGAPDPAISKARAAPVGWTEVTVSASGRPGARRVEVLVWYPARKFGPTAPYTNRVPALGAGASGLVIETPTTASRDAPASKGKHPLVILSHGYGNHPEWLSWIGEFLAARGYVVAAPRHRDPAYVGAQSLIEPVVYRALDQAVVAHGIDRTLAAKRTGATPSADSRRLAVIGYSMGGFGALRAAGASFNPRGAPARVAGARLNSMIEGGEAPKRLLPDLDAMVLLAPWGGQQEISAFTPTSLRNVRAPTLVFAGDKDTTSGYADGVAAIFQCLGSERSWLITFQGAGHNIGLNGAPPNQRDPKIAGHFEDQAWPKSALHGAGEHLIAAFLDRQLKGSAPPRAFPDRAALRKVVGSAWSDRIAIQHKRDAAPCAPRGG